MLASLASWVFTLSLLLLLRLLLRLLHKCEPGFTNIKLSNEYLSDKQQTELRKVLSKYSDVFAQSDSDLGRTDLLEHAIDTQGHAPIFQRPYRVPEAQRKVIETHVKDMAHRGVIRPPKSPWSSPVVLVGKKDGSTRFCVDFRKVNAVTRKDVYPLPRIDETLDTLGGASYFTTLDLASGYWQVPLKEEDKHKTAFKVGDRIWLYTPQVKQGLTSKLAHLWNGPYRIIRKISSVNVEIEESPRRKTIVHVNRCKPYVDRQPRPTENLDNLEKCNVEQSRDSHVEEKN